MFKTIAVILLIFFNTFAQLTLRKGMMNIDVSVLSISTLREILSSIYIWVGLLTYGLGFSLFLYTLSKFEVSYIYPIIMSSVFVVLLILSSIFLNETITLKKMLGIIIISAGIFVISY